MKHFDQEDDFDALKEYETGIKHFDFEDVDITEHNTVSTEISAQLRNLEENNIMLQLEVDELKARVHNSSEKF